MLPFFRKIRYRLAQDNKFLQYSRYAIGEIVLVVIGILIALQINNWNERRKEKTLEKEYLAKLRNEVVFNLKNTKRLLQYHDFVLGNTRLSTKSFVTDISNRLDDLLNALDHQTQTR